MSFPLKVCNYKLGKTLGQGAYGKVKCKFKIYSLHLFCWISGYQWNNQRASCFQDPEQTKNSQAWNARKSEAWGQSHEKAPTPTHSLPLASHRYEFWHFSSSRAGQRWRPLRSHLLLRQGKSSQLSTAHTILCWQLSEAECKRLFKQLTAAMIFSHNKGIAHRDLKLENLLFDECQNLKIADFGLCNMMQDGSSLLTSCGSPDYAAPEIIEHLAYDGTKVDAWSCGVILYTMLYGKLPFDG